MPAKVPVVDDEPGLERLGHIARAVVISAYGDMQNIRSAMNRGRRLPHDAAGGLTGRAK
jgi:hypothetical protein